MESRDRVHGTPTGPRTPSGPSSCLVATSRSPEETSRLGETLGGLLQPGDLVLLRGDLGAGKTTFTRGVARGMGLAASVTSPSFTLANVYAPAGAGLPLYHLDLWRIRSPLEALGIGLDEYLAGDAPCVIEWPDVAADVLPGDALQIQFERAGDARILTFRPTGERPARLVESLREALPSGGRHAPGH